MTLKEKNKKLKIAIQMDSLNNIEKKTDSTLALIEEALKRKYSVFIYTVDNLSLINNSMSRTTRFKPFYLQFVIMFSVACDKFEKNISQVQTYSSRECFKWIPLRLSTFKIGGK